MQVSNTDSQFILHTSIHGLNVQKSKLQYYSNLIYENKTTLNSLQNVQREIEIYILLFFKF